jgi:hypothetical protein
MTFSNLHRGLRMDFARAAIWFYGDSNYTIDHNTFLHNYQDIKLCEGQQS